MDRLVMGGATPMRQYVEVGVQLSRRLEKPLYYGDWEYSDVPEADRDGLLDKAFSEAVDTARGALTDQQQAAGWDDVAVSLDHVEGKPIRTLNGCPVLGDKDVHEFVFSVWFEEPGIDLTRRES